MQRHQHVGRNCMLLLTCMFVQQARLREMEFQIQHLKNDITTSRIPTIVALPRKRSPVQVNSASAGLLEHPAEKTNWLCGRMRSYPD